MADFIKTESADRNNSTVALGTAACLSFTTATGNLPAPGSEGWENTMAHTKTVTASNNSFGILQL
jgi:hypothetical protein